MLLFIKWKKCTKSQGPLPTLNSVNWCPTSRYNPITPKLAMITLWGHCLTSPWNSELLQEMYHAMDLVTTVSLALSAGSGIILLNEWMNDLKEWRVPTTSEQKSRPRQMVWQWLYVFRWQSWVWTGDSLCSSLLGQFQFLPIVPVKVYSIPFLPTSVPIGWSIQWSPRNEGTQCSQY